MGHFIRTVEGVPQTFMADTEIRNESIERLKEAKFPIPEKIGAVLVPRAAKSLNEVVSRVACLTVQMARLFSWPRELTIQWIEAEGLAESLSHNERRFIEEGFGYPPKIMAFNESLWAFLWMLSLIDELDFTKFCGDNMAMLLPNVKELGSLDSFRKKCTLRSEPEIMQMFDIANCFASSYEEMQATGIAMHRSVSKKWQPRIITGRLRAFNWFYGDLPWDDTPSSPRY